MGSKLTRTVLLPRGGFQGIYWAFCAVDSNKCLYLTDANRCSLAIEISSRDNMSRFEPKRLLKTVLSMDLIQNMALRCTNLHLRPPFSVPDFVFVLYVDV